MLAPNLPMRLRFNDADAAGTATTVAEAGIAPAIGAQQRMTVAQFEQRLAQSIAERADARKVCEFTRALEWTANHTYDRRSSGGCDPAWMLFRGQKVTLVAIYEPSTDVRNELRSRAKLGKADAESERKAMAFKIGKRGVPEHAIFRGLFQSSDAAAAVLAGRGAWGAPYNNKCYATKDEESKMVLVPDKKEKGGVLTDKCWVCVMGGCKMCRRCLKRSKSGAVTPTKTGKCAACWKGSACLHDTTIDCRVCWGLPPKEGKAIDAVLRSLHLSRGDFS